MTPPGTDTAVGSLLGHGMSGTRGSVCQTPSFSTRHEGVVPPQAATNPVSVVKVMGKIIVSGKEGGLQPGKGGKRILELSWQQPMLPFRNSPPVSRMLGLPATASSFSQCVVHTIV